MLVVFIVGYSLIVLEHVISVNKAGVALLIGVLAWTIYALGGEQILALGHSESWNTLLQSGAVTNTSESIRHFITEHELLEHLGDTSSILFFLLGAMTIVELIDKYQGFTIITSKIKSTDITRLLWVISILTFFMSALLDNLTTTIIILTLLRKVISKKEFRWVFASLVVMSANAGGAWSPIGDVTTIMLWINGQVTAAAIVTSLFFPSIINMLVVTSIFTVFVKGHRIPPTLPAHETAQFTTPHDQKTMLIMGSLALISVPLFKTYTHLPPFMGMLLGLGAMWVFTDRYLHRKSIADTRKLTVSAALRSVDLTTVLFFLGILMGVAALQSAGHLGVMAEWLSVHVSSIYTSNMIIGVVSAVVDNVPLVAASMGMYDIQPEMAQGALQHFTQNGDFWNLLAYCAGTGGSILIIGSAAGVAAMGIEKINFIWYARRMAWIAFVGYLAGVGTYYLQTLIF